MKKTTPSKLAALGAVFLCAAIAGCGGGGGDPVTSPPSVAPPPSPPAPPAPPLASHAYLLYDSRVELCEFAEGGELSNCDDAGETGLRSMSAMAVAGSHAYIIGVNADDDAALLQCSIGSGGSFSGCADTGLTGLGASYGLTVHGSNLYITSFGSPYVRKCAIDGNGSVNACIDALFPPALADAVMDVQFVNSTAYILDLDLAQISRCGVRDDDGSFESCENTGVPGLNGPTGLSIDGNRMYIANADGNSVAKCTVNDDGSITDCQDSGAGSLSYPIQVAVRGSSAFIANGDESAGVTRCILEADGRLNDCTSVRSESGFLNGIIFK